ncbi:alkaline phosphatase family protein [Desulfothermobacter acidiphilus]|uniref:alkaline phosphatase family protein n=1 Tax=Desulfothermobacter acidiphilus TaxID=1938353 RepID=UPI003F89756E
MLRRLLILLALLLAGALPVQAEEAAPAHSQRFFLLVIDGLERQVVNPAHTPSISGLGAAGVRADKVSGVYPDTPASALATLLTGATPDRHRCFSFQEVPAVPGLPQVLTGRSNAVFFFLSGREECPKSWAGKGKMVREADDAALTAKVLACLQEQQPYLLVVVWRGPALVRVAGGSQQDYLRAVKEADTQVGRLLQLCYGRQIFEHTCFVLAGTTGDPYLAVKAPELRAGVSLPPVSLSDVAPTLAYFMGVKLPAAEGQVLWNAWKPGPERSETYLLELRVKELSEALYTAQGTLRSFLREKEFLTQEKSRIAGEQEEIRRLIERKEELIGNLRRRLWFWKAALVGMLVFSLIGYWWEYRFLRRRHLMF